MPESIEPILVTGAGGFLGGHVAAAFRDRGHAGILAPRRADYDLTRQDRVEALFREHRPRVVVHLAALCGGIGANRRRPGTFYYQNLIMGALLMEQARLAGVRKFVAVGTVCAYPKHTPVPFREEDLWAGYPEETNAPYGLAKKAMLVQAQAYRREFGFDSIYLLPANLYGPGDHFDPEEGHVVPGLIRKFVAAAESGEPEVTCWGTGSATREFLYAPDAAEAIVEATLRYDDAEPMNIGGGAETSIRELAALVARLSGYEGRIGWDPGQPDGQPRRGLDGSRAEAHLGWRAKTTLEDGLRATIAWYREEVCRGPAAAPTIDGGEVARSPCVSP